MFLWVSGAKSQNRRAVVTATKEEKTKANKVLAPLEFQICLQQISRLAFGAGAERRMLISEQRRKKGWEALGGAQPGSTSGKRKQSSGEPSGRAGQGRAAAGYQERSGPHGLAGRRDLGKAHGQWELSGRWKSSLPGRKGRAAKKEQHLRRLKALKVGAGSQAPWAAATEQGAGRGRERRRLIPG